MSPVPPNPPRPGLRLAALRDSYAPDSDASMDPDALTAVVGDLAAKVESLRVEVRAEADDAKAHRVLVQDAFGRVESGVLEAIAIAQRVEKRQRDDAAALRRSSSELERATGDQGAELLRIRTIVAPLMAEASREGSRSASRSVGVFGAVATTVAVVAPHVPWVEIGRAVARALGGG